MPDISTDRFFSLLQQSNLLAAEQLASVRANFAIANEQQLAIANADQLPQLFEQLVNRGWLTRWQAKARFPMRRKNWKRCC